MEPYNLIINNKLTFKVQITIHILLIAIILFLFFIIIPKWKKIIIKNKIRLNMLNNNYLLQYQPIYNPQNNVIVGFEGLLRMLGKNNELILPLNFISEIESNNMLSEVSLWMLEKVISDYSKIQNYECMKDKEFYISINISLKEIENESFVDRAIGLLEHSNLRGNKICLEIIERFKMDDFNKVSLNIKRLKQAGYKLAIDDFGVEYSNLDTFQKLNVDIIKVDKFFVDGIGKDEIRENVISFISRIAHFRNQSVVLEGVEKSSQITKIKEIENDRLFVQGFYYSKPINLENISLL